MHHHNRHLINGEWTAAQSSDETVVFDSFSEAPIASVSHGSANEVDAAVAAARAAFGKWAALSVAERSGYVRKIADALEAQAEVLATAITAEVGMPRKLSGRIQVQAPIAAWRAAADVAEEALREVHIGHSVITKDPVGVVAAITPWNYPLHQITGKLAPALVAGCTIVLKPSELAPASAQALGQAALTAGLPKGVLNIVYGDARTGGALISNASIDMVSFTGSTAVGRHIAAVASANLKRVALELGGKSAGIALADADAALVARGVLASCLLNSGQTCSALTRLIVPESQYDDYLQKLAAGLEKMTLGDPNDAATRVGPLVSAKQRERVESYISAASEKGYDIRVAENVAVPAKGFFVCPTVFGRVPIDATIAQEEVFGPVLIVQTYRSEDEAIAIANGTPYGLAGAVWGADAAKAQAIARRMRTGQVDINGAPYNALAPFGGFGDSGVGREGGVFGIEEFVEMRSIQMPGKTS